MKRMTLTMGLFMMGLTSSANSDVTAIDLADMLEAKTKLTLIDVRSQHAYRTSHIPGAINIPASLVPHKRLPPLGKVIVYGDGIDVAKTREATRQLNTLNGIEADILSGGMGSWQTMHLPDTRSKGMRKQSVYQLSYQELEKVIAGNPNTILVDMRHGTELSDLSALFPQATVIKLRGRAAKSGKISLNKISQRGVNPNALYVLIGNGKGHAERGARRLTAAGVKRLAILAGGEAILKRQGKAGREVSVSSGGMK